MASTDQFPSVQDVPISMGRLLGEEMKENGIPKEIGTRFAAASDRLRCLSEAFPEGSVHRGLFEGLARCVEKEHRDLSPARDDSVAA